MCDLNIWLLASGRNELICKRCWAVCGMQQFYFVSTFTMLSFCQHHPILLGSSLSSLANMAEVQIHQAAKQLHGACFTLDACIPKHQLCNLCNSLSLLTEPHSILPISCRILGKLKGRGLIANFKYCVRAAGLNDECRVFVPRAKAVQVSVLHV